MIKATIELHRKANTTAGVGHGGIPYTQDSKEILDRLLEWAQQPENTGKKVYRHLVRSEDENVRDEPHSWGNSNGYVYPCKADYVIYLDIYHQ